MNKLKTEPTELKIINSSEKQQVFHMPTVDLEDTKAVEIKSNEAEKKLTSFDTQETLLSPRELEYKDKLLRLAAEFENFRIRSKREMEDIRQYSIEKLLLDLLPLLDAIDRALLFAKNENHPLEQGLNLIAKQAEDILSKYSVRTFSSIDIPFNPELHEAIGTVSVPEKSSGVVIEEQLKGYRLYDRLLRAAKVIVNKH